MSNEEFIEINTSSEPTSNATSPNININIKKKYESPLLLLHEPDRCETTTLTILTLNIKGLPSFIDKTSRERVRKIVDLLIEENTDVICIQEAFDKRVIETLNEGLSLAGHYTYHLSNVTYKHPSCFNFLNWLENSGLAIYSKYPISWSQFIPFINAVGSDKFSWKGILGVKIVLPNGLSSAIFTTHLNANGTKYGGYGNNGNVRTLQVKQINNFINAQNHDNLILCGDFNFTDSKPNYKYIIRGTTNFPSIIHNKTALQSENYKLYDIYRKNKDDDEPGYTYDGKMNTNMIPNSITRRRRIDYIFGLKELISTDCELYYPGKIPNDLLSDHFGIKSSIVLKQTVRANTVTVVQPKQHYWKRLFGMNVG